MTTTTPTTALADLPQYTAPDLSRHAMDDSEKATYKDGHRAGWRAAENELRARRAAQPVAPAQEDAEAEDEADRREREYFARWPDAPVTPSPQIAEVAELPPLPPAFMDLYSPVIRRAWQLQMESYARDAIAASRRAAPASAGQAAPADAAMPHVLDVARYSASSQRGVLVLCDGRVSDEGLAAIRARLATQPAEGAGQAGQVAMTEQQVADAIKEKQLITDLGHRALINGDTINASLSLLTRLANSLRA